MLQIKAARPRLYAALSLLDGASVSDLHDVNFVVHAIRTVGLNKDNRDIYGDDNRFMVQGQGLWQVPAEFASLMVLFGGVNITTFFDIGPLYGFTTSLFACYLRRLNPAAHVTAVDFFVEWKDAALFTAALPINYVAPSTT
jgi:hypothetical protein